MSNSRESGYIGQRISFWYMADKAPKATKVGIDLGTTNSCVCCIRNEVPAAVAAPDGSYLLPSAVFYGRNDPILGSIVRTYMTRGRRDIARYSKRVMGKDFTSPEVTELMDQFGCPLIEVNHKPVYSFENRVTKTPEEVGADIVVFILAAVKKYTEKIISDVCITIPAQFDNNQRTATLNAVKKAGIPEDHIFIISEPTAAAVSYLRANPMENGRFLIVDFGGGTFDVSIIRVNNKRITVEANRGNNHLGGLDMDYAILEWMKTEYKSLTGKDLPERDRQGTNKPLLKLLAIAEKAKIELSANLATDIVFEGIQGVDPDLTLQMTRNRLEMIITPFINRAMDVINDALEACGLEKGDINDVILVGGSTRIPVMRDAILNYFNLPPKDNANVDTIVAEGACSFFTYDGKICDRTSHSLGQLTGTSNVQCIIPIDSPLPASYTVEARVKTSLGWVVTYVYQGKATKKDEESSIKSCTSLSPFYYDVSEFADEETIIVNTTFTIKESGVVFVTVTEKKSDKVLLDNKMIEYK